MWKLHEIQISVSTNNLLLEHSHIHLCIISECSHIMTKLSSCERDFMWHSLSSVHTVAQHTINCSISSTVFHTTTFKLPISTDHVKISRDKWTLNVMLLKHRKVWGLLSNWMAKHYVYYSSDTTAVLKEKNIHPYYQTLHSSKYSQFTGKQQSEKFKNSKTEYIITQNFFTKIETRLYPK